MFSYFKGKIIKKNNLIVILEVNNIAYEINSSLNTIDNLPEEGKDTKIFIHLIVREDSHSLYGFSSENELELFKGLIKVSGIGPKLALSILSGISPKKLYETIVNKSVEFLVKIPGVGKKTAERIIVELQGKFQKILSEKYANFSELAITSSIDTSDSKQSAISALISLGYKPEQAEKTVSKVYVEGEKEDDLIRKSLQMISGK